MKNFRFKTRTVIILALFLFAAFWTLMIFSFDFSHPQPSFGVTFSPAYAEELGLDWHETYLALLDDLGVDHIRISAYWNELEPSRDQFYFRDLDWQITQAAKRDVSIIVGVGRRLPRWPECHDPDWLDGLAPAEIAAELEQAITAVVGRYKDIPAIIRWQVENEPLLRWFGRCPAPDKKLLRREIELVRSMDTRPIMTTDSGELGSWVGAARDVDVLGHTLYRIVWNRYFGFWDYWFVPPALYRGKAWLTRMIRPNVEAVIISELQLEPWTQGKRMVELTDRERERSFDLRRLKDHIAYARRTGTSEIYVWGAEYWFWLKVQGQPEIWDTAKSLWRRD